LSGCGADGASTRGGGAVGGSDGAGANELGARVTDAVAGSASGSRVAEPAAGTAPTAGGWYWPRPISISLSN